MHHPRERDDRRHHAQPERHQEEEVHLPEVGEQVAPALGAVEAGDVTENSGVEPGERPDEPLVDAGDERDSPAGDAGDGVRGPHRRPLEVDGAEVAEGVAGARGGGCSGVLAVRLAGRGLAVTALAGRVLVPVRFVCGLARHGHPARAA